MAKLDHNEAKKIYGDLLEQVCQCYVTKDFDTFSQLIHLPHHIRTRSERFVLRTPEDLRLIFDINCATLVTSDGRTLTRKVLDARFKGQDKIDGSHQSILPKEIQEYHRPYPSNTVLMWIGMRWQICASDYHVDESSPICKMLREALRK